MPSELIWEINKTFNLFQPTSEDENIPYLILIPPGALDRSSRPRPGRLSAIEGDQERRPSGGGGDLLRRSSPTPATLLPYPTALPLPAPLCMA